jgi:DNA helicase-2/ATP-dependent DNA helicase PcrA
VDIATFHALGLRLIRQWSHQLGYCGVPAVYGRDDARAVLREAAEGLGLAIAPDGRRQPTDPWAVPLGRLAAAVERFRLGALPKAMGEQEAGDGFDLDLLAPLSEAYDRLLQQRRAVDFAAMLAAPARLFTTHPPALELLQNAYRWVMVDEFQDTTGLQYGLLRQVVARHHNLVVGGDPAQCFPPGTLVQTLQGAVPIESLAPGDAIVAGAGRGTTAVARIDQVLRRDFEGDLVEVTMKSGRVLRMTPGAPLLQLGGTATRRLLRLLDVSTGSRLPRRHRGWCCPFAQGGEGHAGHPDESESRERRQGLAPARLFDARGGRVP